MNGSTDPYNIPLSIFRNREWVQTITIAAVDVSLDQCALVVLPALPSGGASAVLVNKTPLVTPGSGSATWVFTDLETGTLTTGLAYEWQYLRIAAGNSQSDLIVSGPLTVSDSPAFPTS